MPKLCPTLPNAASNGVQELPQDFAATSSKRALLLYRRSPLEERSNLALNVARDLLTTLCEEMLDESRIDTRIVRAFVRELFEYLTTLVPYWRVCDEAWPIFGEADRHLTGIGVLRNYGGQVMVMPWNEDTREQLAWFRESLDPLLDQVVVVVDDREPEDLEGISAIGTAVTVLPWSRRAELVAFVIKDRPD